MFFFNFLKYIGAIPSFFLGIIICLLFEYLINYLFYSSKNSEGNKVKEDTDANLKTNFIKKLTKNEITSDEKLISIIKTPIVKYQENDNKVSKPIFYGISENGHTRILVEYSLYQQIAKESNESNSKNLNTEEAYKANLKVIQDRDNEIENLKKEIENFKKK